MLTSPELLRAVLAPVVVAAILAALARWRGWPWAMPLAAGAGFLAGYALLGVPRLPPRDGTDWLFWLAIPATAAGVLDAATALGRRWGWLAGAITAGVAALVIIRPLVPGGSVSAAALCLTALALAAAGTAATLAARAAEPRVGPAAVVAGLCVVLGGAGIIVMSSNLRVVGVYGVAASAALGPVAVMVGRMPAARSVAVVAAPLLAGLLAGGHFYPDPGVSWTNLVVLAAAPALLLVGVVVPGKRMWLRGAVAVLAVTTAVAAVAVPTARAAKAAAETDPYDAYK